jgi:hypothetical protein
MENVAVDAGVVASGTSHESVFTITGSGGDMLATPMGGYYTVSTIFIRGAAGTKINNNNSLRTKPKITADDVKKRIKSKGKLESSPYDYITFEAYITNGSGNDASQDGVPTFAHRMAYGFEKAISDFQEHSVNYQSLWYENTAQSGSKCGSIYSEQEPGSTHWLATANNLDGYVERNISKEILAEHGAYSFRKPTTQCFDFRNYHKVSDSTGAITDTFWPINHEYQRLTMVLDVPLTDLGNSQSGLWKITNAMEWVTMDPTRSIGVSRYASKVGLAAIDAVKNMRQHYENSVHIKDILSAAKKAVGYASKGLEIASIFI